MSEEGKNPKYIPQDTLVKEIARDPLAADLLFSIFTSAVGTKFLDPKTPKPTEKTIEEIIQNMPPMQTLAGYASDSELEQAIGKDSYNILKHVILESPSSFALLPKSLEIPELRRQNPGDNQERCLQFISISSPENKENIFQQIKAKYNTSYFLLHASKADRWHQIIREELKNLSGIDLIKSGATFGVGIYLYPQTSEAVKHIGPNENKYPNSQLGKQISILALCEVPDLPWGVDVTIQVEGQPKPINGILREFNSAFTLTLEQACMVRILLVNCDADVNVKTGIQKVPTLSECLNSKE